ncbi:MAG TPA: hypothetical protein VFH37_01900 [Candidatus Saccharimonadales bacterium]|nr:hypothetical protein [Candidatus Saccharimonadales bacterium]
MWPEGKLSYHRTRSTTEAYRGGLMGLKAKLTWLAVAFGGTGLLVMKYGGPLKGGIILLLVVVAGIAADQIIRAHKKR